MPAMRLRTMRENRWAGTSVAVLAGGWVWLGLFLASHMDALYPSQWWVQGAAFVCYLFSPVALVFGVAALFERPKSAAVLAIVLSLASVGLVFWATP